MGVLENIEPKEVLSFFEELSGRHRCSQHEKDATDYIADFAEKRALTYHRDGLDNIIVKKPGTKGYEAAPTVILHGHIDMVCKLAEGVTHDFATDGVKLRVDGDRIRASGTTLGADNGLGISYMLALLDSDDIPHPPLECVMTVMEEMGKVGGDNVDLTKLTGKRMIDFNWIEEKQLLAGCSGDVSCRIDVDAEWQAPPAEGVALAIDIRGLLGGHCEFDIHFERGNAIALLARLLRAAMKAGTVGVATISGGVQNNVIPAEAQATMLVAESEVDAVTTAVEALTPDFNGNTTAVETVVDSGLQVFAQNIETVERLTHPVRDPRAGYAQTLAVLQHAKRHRAHGSRRNLSQGLFLGNLQP